VCERLDSRISNNEFIISSGMLLVTPVISFNLIIIINISFNIMLERVVPFYFPPFKWKAPLYVIPNSFDLLNVCVIFIPNASVGNFCIISVFIH